MTIKIKVVDVNVLHVRSKVFAGEGDTLAFCGDLCMKVGEYQSFACALSLGAKQMQPISGGSPKVVVDEEKFVEWTNRKEQP